MNNDMNPVMTTTLTPEQANEAVQLLRQLATQVDEAMGPQCKALAEVFRFLRQHKAIPQDDYCWAEMDDEMLDAVLEACP